MDLRQFLTPKAVARSLNTTPKLHLPIRNAVFDRSVQHPLPIIGLDEIQSVIRNVPVVRRGGSAVPVGHEARGIAFIEPQGVDVSTFLSAADLNNWRVLSGEGLQKMMDNKLHYQQGVTRKTTEALCAQAITGTISYPMKVDGGVDTYDVSFGAVHRKNPAATALWSASGTTVGDIFTQLTDLESLIQDAGWGGQIEVLASREAYASLLTKSEAANNKAIKVTVTKEGVYLGHFKVSAVNAVYQGDTGAVREIPAGEIVMIDMSAPHTLFYLALDDLDAGLVPLPFFASPEIKRNPSGVEIVGRSKPLPAPVVGAIAWSKVV